MMFRTSQVIAALLVLSSIAISACEPEVGSEAWCEKLDETPKGEWTLEEVGDYAKHCVIRSGDDSG